jgi:hypothetical protein
MSITEDEQVEATEESFRARVARAYELAALVPALVAEGKPEFIDGDDFPSATLRAMEAWATIEYKAVLRLVEDPEVAHAAEVLLRALLEYFAHVIWIADGLDGGEARTPRCRALCLELGIAKEAEAALTKKLRDWGDASDPEGQRITTAAVERLSDIRALHQGEACRCSGRNGGGVQPTLAALWRQDQKWALGLWVVATHAAHQVLPARIQRDTGQGITAIGEPASLAWRSDLLNHGVLAYGLAGVGILDVENPDQIDKLKAWLTAFLGSTFTTMSR